MEARLTKQAFLYTSHFLTRKHKHFLPPPQLRQLVLLDAAVLEG